MKQNTLDLNGLSLAARGGEFFLGLLIKFCDCGGLDIVCWKLLVWLNEYSVWEKGDVILFLLLLLLFELLLDSFIIWEEFFNVCCFDINGLLNLVVLPPNCIVINFCGI